MNSMQLIKLVELLMHDQGRTGGTGSAYSLEDKIRISKRGHAISCICI